MNFLEIEARLKAALNARIENLQSDHSNAFRIFNGYLEGFPGLVIEVFASTLVISDAAYEFTSNEQYLKIFDLYSRSLIWLDAAVVKRRNANAPNLRNGQLIHGSKPSDRIHENGVWYAIDLSLQQDNSFYLDTRFLRSWLKEHASGWNVLNTFAYTGSLGVACQAGGAIRVIQADRNRRFLALAKQSAKLNGFEISEKDYLGEDFFSTASRFRHSKKLFDCVLIDPPFFSQSSRVTVDLEKEFSRLINKIRPLVADGGAIIAINNSLYVSGRDYLAQLEDLTKGGYVKIEENIQVPADCTGYPPTIVDKPPVETSPFNHSTKIAILRIRKISNSA